MNDGKRIDKCLAYHLQKANKTIQQQAEQIADYNNQYDSLKSIIGDLERRLEFKDAENKKLEELIFAYDAVRSPIIDRTILELQAENQRLKEMLADYIEFNNCTTHKRKYTLEELEQALAAQPQKGQDND